MDTKDSLLGDLGISEEKCKEILNIFNPRLAKGESKKLIYNEIMCANFTDKEKLCAFYLWGCGEGYLLCLDDYRDFMKEE